MNLWRALVPSVSDPRSDPITHSGTPPVLLNVERAGVEPAGAECKVRAREPSVLPAFLIKEVIRYLFYFHFLSFVYVLLDQ